MRLPCDARHEIDEKVQHQRHRDGAKAGRGAVSQQDQEIAEHQTVQPAGQSDGITDPGHSIFQDASAYDRTEQNDRKPGMTEKLLQRTEIIQSQQIHRDMPGLDMREANGQKPPPLSPADALPVIAAAPDRARYLIRITRGNVEKYNSADRQHGKPYGHPLAEDGISSCIWIHLFPPPWKHRFLPDNPRPASGHQIDTIILYGIILTVVQASCEEAARPDVL